jgi:hypothetical protein
MVLNVVTPVEARRFANPAGAWEGRQDSLHFYAVTTSRHFDEGNGRHGHAMLMCTLCTFSLGSPPAFSYLDQWPVAPGRKTLAR